MTNRTCGNSLGFALRRSRLSRMCATIAATSRGRFSLSSRHWSSAKSIVPPNQPLWRNLRLIRIHEKAENVSSYRCLTRERTTWSAWKGRRECEKRVLPVWTGRADIPYASYRELTGVFAVLYFFAAFMSPALVSRGSRCCRAISKVASKEHVPKATVRRPLLSCSNRAVPIVGTWKHE